MSDSQKLSDLRKSYELGDLSEHDSGDSPFHLFEKWLNEAFEKKIPEPNAMTLATVSAEGRPSTRPVLIKDFDEKGIVWFTNYNSRKGQDLLQSPLAALQFHWIEMERVVRIEGRVEKVDPETSDEYYASRPLTHRIGAWASEQSQVISGRSIIVARAASFGLKFGLNPPRPDHWGGYRLVPDYWEFWQGRASRLHDRIVFVLNESQQWERKRLAP